MISGGNLHVEDWSQSEGKSDIEVIVAGMEMQMLEYGAHQYG